MPDRRTFIKSGLAFSTLSLSGISGLQVAVGAPDGSLLTLDNFIKDTRFTESSDAAMPLAEQGVPIVEINGDLTDLWYSKYSLSWKKQPMTLAGVTGQDALFVLETLAPDYGMQLVHKEQLVSSAKQNNVELYSWIIAPKKLIKASV